MWEFFKEFYFANLVMVLATISTASYGILRSKNLRKLKILVVYSFLALLQGSFALILIELDNNLESFGSWVIVSLNIFVLFEFTLFNLYYLSIIKSERFRLFIRISSIIFLLCFVSWWIYSEGHSERPSLLSTIQVILISVPVLYFLFESLKNITEMRMIENPHFWVSVGILLMFAINAPLFFLSSLMPDFPLHGIYILNYMAYTFLFSCLTYAFICQTRLVKS